MESSICQYCYEAITYGDNHLDYCNIYKTIMVHLNSPNSSEEELPNTQQLYDFRNENLRLYSKPQVFPLRPVRKSLNACPQCKSIFHNLTNTPYLLPACGHSFCKTCLGKMSYKSMIRCSLCSSMTYKELKKLPINYALVEALERTCKKPKCKEHNSEIMGYCCTDETLLCGTCTFAHRAHVVYLLTDPKIKEIANCKKESIKKQEQELLKLKENWEKVKIEMQLGMHELHLSVDKHKKALESTEEKICIKVTQGCNFCIDEINSLTDGGESEKIKTKINENLLRIHNRFEKIQDVKSCYDSLPVVEKLNKPLESEEIDYDFPPSLTPIIKVLEKLKGKIEYKTCIKQQKLEISEI